jgi:hypothetical protein
MNMMSEASMILDNFLTVIFVLIGLAIVWTILRVVLKLTMRLFSIGCVAIVILVAAIWLIGQLA